MSKLEQAGDSYFDRIKNTLELRGPSQEFIEEVRELLGFSHVIMGRRHWWSDNNDECM
jgi:hypothetical protein